MADSVLILGRPGSGKSTGIETLDPTSTFIINVANKPFPFKGSRKLYTAYNSKDKTGNMVSSAKASVILQAMKEVNDNLPHIKSLVLED